MPEINADKIIGRTLFASRQLEKLNSALQKTGVINAGASAGVVYSYIQRGGNVYWQFKDPFGKYYYIKHTANSFQLSPGVKEAFEEVKQEKEKQLLQEKGAVPYYIEKYGKWVLGAYIAVVLAREFIKRKK